MYAIQAYDEIHSYSVVTSNKWCDKHKPLLIKKKKKKVINHRVQNFKGKLHFKPYSLGGVIN
jgi:hypothetical protein